MGKNVIIFGAEMSSSVDADFKGKDILISFCLGNVTKCVGSSNTLNDLSNKVCIQNKT